MAQGGQINKDTNTTYRRLPNLWRTEKDRQNSPCAQMSPLSANRPREVRGSEARVDCWVRDLG
jgi:hypothetical protein